MSRICFSLYDFLAKAVPGSNPSRGMVRRYICEISPSIFRWQGLLAFSQGLQSFIHKEPLFLFLKHFQFILHFFGFILFWWRFWGNVSGVSFTTVMLMFQMFGESPNRVVIILATEFHIVSCQAMPEQDLRPLSHLRVFCPFFFFFTLCLSPF